MKILFFSALTTALLLTSCGIKSPLVARMTADGKYWILEKPLVYENSKTGNTYQAPRGFVTDLASVPQVFWSALPPCSNYTPAAVVHDYLYWNQPDGITQAEADRILLDAMEESGVKYPTRTAIYTAVRAQGHHAWEENKRLRKIENRLLDDNDMALIQPHDRWLDIKKKVSKPKP